MVLQVLPDFRRVDLHLDPQLPEVVARSNP